jgi:hypothetical protein
MREHFTISTTVVSPTGIKLGICVYQVNIEGGIIDILNFDKGIDSTRKSVERVIEDYIISRCQPSQHSKDPVTPLEKEIAIIKLEDRRQNLGLMNVAHLSHNERIESQAKYRLEVMAINEEITRIRSLP